MDRVHFPLPAVSVTGEILPSSFMFRPVRWEFFLACCSGKYVLIISKILVSPCIQQLENKSCHWIVFTPYSKIAIPHPVSWSNYLIVHLSCFATQRYKFYQAIISVEAVFLNMICKAITLSSFKGHQNSLQNLW